MSIGDFETLTYEHGPHKTHSRLKLLVSPSCRPPDGSALFCFQEIPPNCFKFIKDKLQKSMESLNLRSMSSIRKAKARFKHGNVVGVCDPTGYIPNNHVFLTRMGEMDKLVPSEVFLSRYPCAGGKDSIVAKVASWQDIPKEAFQSLDGLDFGAIVFPLGDSPPNEGDLDGVLYHCICDQKIWLQA